MPSSLGGPKAQTVGFKYYLGMHLIAAHGPVDLVSEIRIGGRVAWSGSVTSSQQISIDEEELFGGEGREGGVVGPVDVAFGDGAQGVNDYLSTQLGTPQPAYRGVLGFVFRQTYLTANNPNIKPIAVKVKRLYSGWNPGENEINDGANPAHIIYECLTNSAWGMGYPQSAVDSVTFGAAATTLVAEEFGLNLIWTQQAKIQDFLQDVLDHIAGVLVVSPSTGKFELTLIRYDYTPAALTVYDESSVLEAESYERAGWGETINEVTVVYTRPENYEDASVTVQDLANVQLQGVVAETKNYPGIIDGDLAARVAMRDLTAVSRALAKVTLLVNRTAWTLLPGAVFKFSWADLGIVEMILRVVSIDTGELTDGSIRIEAIEDVFAFPDNAYTTPEPIGFVDPTPAPADATPRLLLEATYWDISQRMTADELAALDPTIAYLATLMGRPSNGAYNYALHTIGTGDSWGDSFRSLPDFAPHAAIVEALITELTTMVTLTTMVDVDLVRVGDYAIIENPAGNGAQHESVQVTALDAVAGTATLKRGLLDTVPMPHLAGARIWFAELYAGSGEVEYTQTETVYVRALTRTSLGELSIDTAATENITFARRQDRPYPPGNLKVNAVAYPLAYEGDLALTWSSRNRLIQTVDYPEQDHGNYTPEPGVTYNMRIYGETDALQRTYIALAVLSDTYTEAEDIADNGLGRVSSKLRITIESQRASYTSHQQHDITVDKAGWGFHWGKYYGGAG